MKGWFESIEEDDLNVLPEEIEELQDDELDLREAAFMQGYIEEAEAYL